jgi:hypothetical protein
VTGDRQVAFTDYALMRMHRRDIFEDEVRGVLSDARTQHRRRRDHRSEARLRIGRKTLLVVYRREERTMIVINAMWE